MYYNQNTIPSFGSSSWFHEWNVEKCFLKVMIVTLWRKQISTTTGIWFMICLPMWKKRLTKKEPKMICLNAVILYYWSSFVFAGKMSYVKVRMVLPNCRWDKNPNEYCTTCWYTLWQWNWKIYDNNWTVCSSYRYRVCPREIGRYIHSF